MERSQNRNSILIYSNVRGKVDKIQNTVERQKTSLSRVCDFVYLARLPHEGERFSAFLGLLSRRTPLSAGNTFARLMNCAPHGLIYHYNNRRPIRTMTGPINTSRVFSTLGQLEILCTTSGLVTVDPVQHQYITTSGRIAELEARVSADDRNLVLRLQLGDEWARLQTPEGYANAIKQYQDVVLLDPNYVDAHLRIAELQLTIGRAPDARKSLTSKNILGATAGNKQGEITRLGMLGRSYLCESVGSTVSDNVITQAIAAFRTAYALKPGNDTGFDLASALLEKGGGSEIEAGQIFSRFISGGRIQFPLETGVQVSEGGGFLIGDGAQSKVFITNPRQRFTVGRRVTLKITNERNAKLEYDNYHTLREHSGELETLLGHAIIIPDYMRMMPVSDPTQRVLAWPFIDFEQISTILATGAAGMGETKRDIRLELAQRLTDSAATLHHVGRHIKLEDVSNERRPIEIAGHDGEANFYTHLVFKHLIRRLKEIPTLTLLASTEERLATAFDAYFAKTLCARPDWAYSWYHDGQPGNGLIRKNTDSSDELSAPQLTIAQRDFGRIDFATQDKRHVAIEIATIVGNELLDLPSSARRYLTFRAMAQELAYQVREDWPDDSDELVHLIRPSYAQTDVGRLYNKVYDVMARRGYSQTAFDQDIIAGSIERHAVIAGFQIARIHTNAEELKRLTLEHNWLLRYVKHRQSGGSDTRQEVTDDRESKIYAQYCMGVSTIARTRRYLKHHLDGLMQNISRTGEWELKDLARSLSLSHVVKKENNYLSRLKIL